MKENEFVPLRARAREKRDKAIAHARYEYEATLVQIATLEQDLLGKLSSRYQKISACIESLIPRDESFTTVDIMAGLEALDPGRVWRKRSVDNHIFRLRERGLIRRLKRSSGTDAAIYVRVGVPVEESPTGDMLLSEVIRAVLTKPRNVTEAVVAILEAGYQSKMSRRPLRNAVLRELNRGGYRKEGARWVGVAQAAVG